VNILLASVDAFPQVGGISSMSHHLANAFAMLGHDVVFVAPAGCHVPRELVRDYQLMEDLEAQPKRRAGDAGYEEDERIRALFERLIDRYGIDRTLLLHPFYYAIGALDACHRRRIPFSVYFHGFELRSQLRDGYPKRHREVVATRRLGTLRERVFYTVGAADEILVNSRYTASLVEGFSCKPSIRATGCGIPEHDLVRELDMTPFYDAEEKRRRRAQSALPSEPCIAFVGRLVPAKGVERLLRLCKASPALSAVILGTGPDEERLRALTARWALTERVRFLGRVTETQKWSALRAADFLCLLSEADDKTGQVEGFGIALLEGAAAGAVPVSSGTGGMTDVVSHGRTGLVLPRDDHAAAALLERTVADPASMRSLSERARQQLRERYNWTAVADAIAAEW
jgi:glycosyltransferase involved in cell wall biosynthesis